MENDINIQIKNVVDYINQLQYLVSVTTCIHERYYYNDLLSHYYYVYHQLFNIANKNIEDEHNEE
ncbi:MAG: hypothetical protein K0Q49_1476 [Haloplasmataceae bacterium]|jgi:hypothetical protein|nr:hypothetical protein [Haloplasmataceae bacterium]